MTTLLAGDIGGTKTLLALYREQAGQLELLRSERYSSADWPDLAPMLQAFLGDATPPQAACLAVAGPVRQGQAQLTNLPWRLQNKRLAEASGIACVELVNDFAVLIHGLPHLRAAQQACLRPGDRDPAEPVLVLGAGTGLGVAFGVPGMDGQLQALASEAAHGEFAPRTAAEWRLKQWLQQDLAVERLSIERVVSGTGLGHVARWLLSEHHPDGDHPLQQPQADLPAAAATAAAAGDLQAREARDLWLGAYGSVAGDLALTGLCRGGLWLAGGTAAKLQHELAGPLFMDALLAKGRLSGVLEPLAVTAITDPSIGQFSAACRARELARHR
jgi:glucokinase